MRKRVKGPARSVTVFARCLHGCRRQLWPGMLPTWANEMLPISGLSRQKYLTYLYTQAHSSPSRASGNLVPGRACKPCQPSCIFAPILQHREPFLDASTRPSLASSGRRSIIHTTARPRPLPRPLEPPRPRAPPLLAALIIGDGSGRPDGMSSSSPDPIAELDDDPSQELSSDSTSARRTTVCVTGG